MATSAPTTARAARGPLPAVQQRVFRVPGFWFRLPLSVYVDHAKLSIRDRRHHGARSQRVADISTGERLKGSRTQRCGYESRSRRRKRAQRWRTKPRQAQCRGQQLRTRSGQPQRQAAEDDKTSRQPSRPPFEHRVGGDRHRDCVSRLIGTGPAPRWRRCGRSSGKPVGGPFRS